MAARPPTAVQPDLQDAVSAEQAPERIAAHTGSITALWSVFEDVRM
jgi:hypothetical protein